MQTKTQSRRFQIPSGSKNVIEKLRFRAGLVRTVGLTVEMKLRFEISPVLCGRGPKYKPVLFKTQNSFRR